VNFEGKPENNTEKERVENIALQFLATLESIENQNRIIDLEAASGDKMHVPTLERDEDGNFKLIWYGKVGEGSGWETKVGPTDISNADALKTKLKNVEAVKEMLHDKLKKEVEAGILRAGIYLSSVR
jgi:hypothetical protein